LYGHKIVLFPVYVKLTIRVVNKTTNIPRVNVSNRANTPSSLPETTPPHNVAYSFSPNIAHISDETSAISLSGLGTDVKAESTRANNTRQASDRPKGLKGALKAFQMRITYASKFSGQVREGLISEAFHSCRPVSKGYSYTVMVIRELLQLQFDPKAVLEQHHTPSFVVPNVYSHEALDLLVSLDKIMLQYPHCVPDIHQIYVSMAKSASVNSVNPYQDTRLLTLVRQLWHAAHLQGVGLDESTLRLLRSLIPRCMNQAYRNTLGMIFAVVSRLDNTDILQTLIAQTAKDPGLVSAVVKVLQCVPKEYLSYSIPKITLAHAKRTKNGAQMHVWLQILHHLDADAALPDKSLVEIATISLAEYALSHPRNVQQRLPALLSAFLVNASQTSAFRDVPMSKISDFLQAFDAKVRQSGYPHVDATLGILMTDLRGKMLPYQAVAEMIVHYFTRYLGLEATSKFLQVLERRQLFLANAEPLCEVVAVTLAHVKSHGSTIQDRSRLRACAKILDILNQTGAIPRHFKAEIGIEVAQGQFHHILSQARKQQMLPLAYRKVHARSSVEQRIGLIHQLAHQYTTNTTLSRLEALRAVSYLYRHLREHALPIGPLFTKAIVRICIIRPLVERRFVSAKRLIWVCKLVSSIEGEEVAKQIESLFWHWRGDVIQHAKTAYIGAGGDRQNKAHVGTMKKLGLI
jgi:hypothetical protein